MRIIRHFCFILSLPLAAPVFSQNITQQSADYAISSETMHVHFDKDIYLPGETIWFKAYLYNVSEISFSSTNFYVAIYDEAGKLIKQKQYPVLEGSCSGDFEIPDTIQSNRIRFRAFTKAMVTDDSNNVYERVLTVYRKENKTGDPFISKTISLQFFPEGGRIIAELRNYIVFKATYNDGSPAIVNGQIIETARNKIVDTFFTDKTGLGAFNLVPSPHKNYMAVWKDENGETKQTPLPEIMRYGVSFHAEVLGKELQYTIAKNRSSDSLSLFHLLAQMGNYTIYQADLVIANEMELSTAKFSIDSVPPGLLQLTLFDKYRNILQERLVFINTAVADKQSLIINDTTNTKPKSKNVIEIILPDTLFTNLSVSVADINFYEQPASHSIKQELWFDTQLKEPGQDINSLLTPGQTKALDNTVLAHNCKMYNWQRATNKALLKTGLLDNYISLSIYYKEKNLALPKDDALNLIIDNKGRNKQFFNLKPADQTSFKLDYLLIFDSVRVSYQMDKNKEIANYLTVYRDSSLKIPPATEPLKKEIRTYVTQPVEKTDELEAFYSPAPKRFNDVQTIKGVTVKTKNKGNPILARIDELDKFYTTGMFSGTIRGVMFNIIDDTLGVTANNNLQDYLLYRIPGVKKYGISFGKDEAVIINGKLKIVTFPVITFIDEVEMDQMGGIPISSLVLSDVAYVKYIQGVVIGAGFKTSHGALYVYTKKGTEKGPSSKGLSFVYIKGYDTQKEFSNKDYVNMPVSNEPDLRTTLYWNPNLVLDKINNKGSFEFYNNDVSKRLLLTIEGVNASGKLIHIEKIIE